MTGNDIHKTIGHTAYQVLDHCRSDLIPGFEDSLFQLVRGLELAAILVDLAHKDPPQVFHWIEVRAAGWPVQNGNIIGLEPGASTAACMNAGVVLLINQSTTRVRLEKRDQMILQNVLIILRIHSTGDEGNIQRSETAESRPNHA